MPRYAFLVEYDGTPFHGWQRQAGGQPSVQASLEAALAKLDPAGPLVQGSGRTDTGVHATGQVAHADLGKPWDTFRLVEAMNHHLRPAPVSVLAAAAVAEDFHARFSALERRYTFRLLVRRGPPVLDRHRVWAIRHHVDLGAMQQGAAHLVGKHDFTTFRSAWCQAASPVKTLDELTLERHDVPGGFEVHFHLRARSFLHNQVRSIVGTLERVGAGAWSADRVAEALAAKDRAACGPVSPPQGLYLTGVRYSIDPFAAQEE